MGGEREREDWMLYFALLVSCGCYCSVVLSGDAVGWSAVCDCYISFLHSLTFLSIDIFPGSTIMLLKR